MARISTEVSGFPFVVLLGFPWTVLGQSVQIDQCLIAVSVYARHSRQATERPASIISNGYVYFFIVVFCVY